MKIFLTSMLLSTLVAVSFYALADTDFARIKKDVTVMSQILKSAFESNRKAGRGVRVEGSYLASQGAVFTVNTPPAVSTYAFRFNTDDADSDFVIYSGDDAAPPIPPVPPVDLGEISANVQLALEGLDDAEWFSQISDLPGFHYDGGHGISRETRTAMRELARNVRDIEREISENRIQLIHVEEAAERKDLEKEIATLEKQRGEYEAKLERLEANLEAEREKLEAKRTEMREKALAARKEQMALLESTIMQSLCDYGSTLKNLPDKEHISVVIKRVTGNDEQQVYVFNKDDVTTCRTDGQRLKQQATAYLY